ncbi:hypothetical protein DPMN_164781 [Dreissena polymorpha]|uniref:PHD-type domain-containing protein n=1 Tax=Dreissena polymorpha TaxID=45954 RepID=A0A9D4EWH4_DREPO|nr:hypothetical protein DPMN_164781 [Dreissena polymorpha]
MSQDQQQGKKNRNTKWNSVSPSTPNESTEGWICKLCKKKFTEDSVKIMQCEYCSEYYCSTCLKLSNADYESFKNPLFHWFCPSCDAKVMRNVKQERDIEERCAAWMNKMEIRKVKLEEEMLKKSGL